MTDIAKQIAKLSEQAEELQELREDVFNEKADITVTAVGILLQKLDEGITDLITSQKGQEFYDKELGDKIKEAIAGFVKGITELKPPQITVAPIDLKPLQAIANNITGQNNVIIGLMNKMGGDNTAELQRMVTAMIGKQNIFLERAFKETDYTAELRKISDALGKNDKVEKLTVVYGEYNRIKEVIPVYKK